MWILKTDSVNIYVWMTFIYVDYEMGFLAEMQAVELEKAELL